MTGSSPIRRLAGGKDRLWPYGVILLAALTFFWPFLLQGKVFMAADTLSMYYPWKSYAPQGFKPHNTLITDPVNGTYVGVYNQELKTGGLREWNPYLLAGLPNNDSASMSGAPGRYGPLKLLYHRFFSIGTAHNLVLFSHLLLMGVTMFLYLEQVGAGQFGALFGAVAFMFNGWAMVWFSFESVVASSALLPLPFMIMEKFSASRKWSYAFGGALVMGTIALMGSIQYLLYTAMMMLAYLAFILARAWRGGTDRRGCIFILTSFAVMCAGGIVISGIVTLPAAEFLSNSSRISRTFTFQGLFDTLSRVYYRYFVTLIFPYFFGSPVHWFNIIPRLPAQEYMNFNELCFYMGVPTIFALLACAATWRNAISRYYLCMTILVAAMMAGTYAYYPIFKLIPGLNKTNPSRIIFVFTFTAAAAAGLGVRALEDLGGRAKKIFLGLVLLLATGVTALALLGTNQGMNRWFNREILHADRGQGVSILNVISGLRSLSSEVIYKPLLITLASAVLFGLYVTVKDRRRRGVVFGILVCLLGFDLISFGQGYNTLVDPKTIFPRTPSIDFLLRQPKPFRVVLDARAMQVNSLAPYGIEEVGGYSSVYPERTNKLMSLAEFGPGALQGRGFDRWVMFANILSPIFELMNARYLLTAPGAVVSSPNLRLVYSGDMNIYENTRAQPRAFVVHQQLRAKDPEEIFRAFATGGFDPGRTVVLEEDPGPGIRAADNPYVPTVPVSFEYYGSDEIRLRAEPAADGWLVLTNTFYPGWRAEVDGRDTKIYRADSLFQAIPLTAGRHQVRFVFRSVMNRWGGGLTLAGLIAISAGLFWSRRREGRSSPPARGV